VRTAPPASRWFDIPIGQDDQGKGPQWATKAAFELHQAAERYDHCVLLVLTLTGLKPHNLNYLRSPAERLDGRLIDA
jgi:hypothetical protein